MFVILLTIIIGVDRRSTDKRSKIDSDRLALFLSFCYAPERHSPLYLYILLRTFTKNSFH